MEVASNKPIQIGIVWSPSSVFRITIGVLELGSMVRPAIFALSSIQIISFQPILERIAV